MTRSNRSRDHFTTKASASYFGDASPGGKMVFQSDGGVSKAAKTVAAVLKGLDIDADKNAIDAAQGGAAWQISRGSADIIIGINPPVKDGGVGRLRVISPIVRFDGDVPAALMTKLLELNGTKLPGVAFGIIGGNVVLVGERSVAGLDRVEFEEMLSSVGFYGDKYDDLLVNEFGGTRVCDLG